MLNQLIATHPQIKNPNVILVTDRIDLNDQITVTFKMINSCGECADGQSSG
ncbi:hypothetical protein [Anditalea andensis]|uniref:hypothetical protein n=1 Tax=Anditalea andensis TaxID=1048983 RepID=UPI001F0B56D3|nr:hypothetical protein [Anditalea andensis]